MPAEPTIAEPPLAAHSPSALFRIAAIAPKRRLALTVTVLGLSGHQLAETLVPVVIGQVIDQAIAPSDTTALLFWLAALCVLFCGLIVSWRYAIRAGTRVFSHGEHELRLLAARRVLHPHGMADRRTPGDVLTIATADAANTSGISWVIAEQFAALTALVTAVVSLLVLSWPLAILVVVTALLQLLAIYKISGPLDERVYREQRQAARASSLATDFVLGLRVLKGFGAETEAAARYRGSSRESMRAALRRITALASLSAINSAISALFLASITLTAAWMALAGSLTIGGFVTVIGLSQLVAGPMETLGFLGGSIASKRGSARRLAELTATEPRVSSHQSASENAGLSAAQPSPGVDHQHAPQPLLRVALPGDANLTIHQGQLIGVQAASQAGEALCELLGFRRPIERGTYSLGGIDAVDVGPVAVHERVFAAPHSSTLFAGSVRENLATDAVDPAIVAASGLDELLTHLPHGLDSEVGENGRLLSGGQRQRVILARALHQPQPVIVLHEPTSSVDSLTEHRIAEALRGFEQKAIIVITSSPTLLHSCDQLVELAA